MSTMVEKVALFIRVASPRAGRTKEDGDLRSIPLPEAVCMDLAHAAVSAMREPHPLELFPGVAAYIEVDKSCRPVALRAAWNAVIDAALSGDA